ncbi:MAG: tripartite tricarboxylate transporter TctB family protein [Variibacter sp.]|nr:tripartite tricarboxylate transporter TctB family protein [Variibacter sp.]
MQNPRGIAAPELGLGIGLLMFSGLVFWQIVQIPVSPLYAKIGPTVFPYVSGVGLAILSCFLIAEACMGGWQPDEEKEVPLDWRALLYVGLGLIANVSLITWLGFTLASTVMFVLIARGFGSGRPLRDALIGFAVALASYFGFAKALGVNIGAGLVEQRLEAMLAVLFPSLGN